MKAASISQITPHLYLGSAEAAFDKSLLNSFKITHIVCCASELAPAFPKDFKYLSTSVTNDQGSEPMLPGFHTASAFIAEGVSTGNVLVHWYRLAYYSVAHTAWEGRRPWLWHI